MFWCCNTEKSTVECVKPVSKEQVTQKEPDNKLVINTPEPNPINYDQVISDTRPRLNSGFTQVILESAYSK